MKQRTKYVAVLFGPNRRAGDLAAPGDADCRWRVVATLERAAAVNDETASLADPASAAADSDVQSKRG